MKAKDDILKTKRVLISINVSGYVEVSEDTDLSELKAWTAKVYDGISMQDLEIEESTITEGKNARP